MRFWDSSGISWTMCKQSAPRSRQITTPTPHHSDDLDSSIPVVSSIPVLPSHVPACVCARFRPLPRVQKSEDAVETLRQSEGGWCRRSDARRSHLETRRSGDKATVLATLCTRR